MAKRKVDVGAIVTRHIDNGTKELLDAEVEKLMEAGVDNQQAFKQADRALAVRNLEDGGASDPYADADWAYRYGGIKEPDTPGRRMMCDLRENDPARFIQIYAKWSAEREGSNDERKIRANLQRNQAELEEFLAAILFSARPGAEHPVEAGNLEEVRDGPVI